MIFKGILTALITPLDENDNIDFRTLQPLIERQIASGINGLVVAGSTGEGSSLSDEEYYELIKTAIDCSKGRISIIASTVGVSTVSVCEKVSILSSMDINGLMCTVPHYIRPEQEGLYQHFQAINNASTLPIMIYLHPGRTSCDMSDNTIIRLSALDKIVALKDCSNDIEKPLRLLPQVSSTFVFLTGDDNRFLAYSAHGGVGCVSVIANIFPKLCKKIESAWSSGNFDKARELQQNLMPFMSALFSESNPIGIKYAAHELKLCSDKIRLPLTKAREDTRRKINDLMTEIVGLEKDV
jgi:4-hydroxy-tetrahydrodipicolinate synthase